MNIGNKYFEDEIKIFLLLLGAILFISILGQIVAFGGLEISVQKHVAKILFSILIMIVISNVNYRFWSSYAYVMYAICFCSLIFVHILGTVKLGAQRWLDLYVITLQPSEFMKLTLILALAKYYSMLSSYELKITKNHIFPLMLVAMPAFLILNQPDLGTATLLFGVGMGMIFLAGFPTKAFMIFVLGLIAACPVGWHFLHEYQKNRILNFIFPERDPLGSGYHILQSKIAIGSGHIFGKGILQGTQSSLNFLPEKHTDFIFTAISEELGFVGAVIIILLLTAIVFYFFWVGGSREDKFSRHLGFGLALLLFIHTFINIGMVIGILPVVGVPLPFLSYGGSSLVTFAISCGLIISMQTKPKKLLR